MNQLSLEEIREIELDLLIKFDAFCKEHQIRYFLSNGTLLGAVKYEGFIPWDDDIDVLVPRKDYDKLIATFKDDHRYRLFSFGKDRKFPFPFAKLCRMDTKKVEANDSKNFELGIDIDIFPLDAWHSDLKMATREARRIHRMMFCLTLTKQKRPDSVNPLKRAIKGGVMLLCKILGSRFFIKMIIRGANNIRGESVYLGCKSWCIYREREIISANVFSNSVNIPFEGLSLPAPVGYDSYLRSLYGDYEKDPPTEKQRSHHSFTAFSNNN